MIDGRNFFDEPVKNDFRKYDHIWKIVIGLGDDYTNGGVLDYPYFKKYHKLIAKDWQQKLDPGPKLIQQINFIGNLDRDGNTQMFFIIEELKETFLDFSKGKFKVL